MATVGPNSRSSDSSPSAAAVAYSFGSCQSFDSDSWPWPLFVDAAAVVVGNSSSLKLARSFRYGKKIEKLQINLTKQGNKKFEQ